MPTNVASFEATITAVLATKTPGARFGVRFIAFFE